MNEEQVADIWMTFKEYLDKKHIDNAAERFVDLMADYGVTDETFKDSFGHCTYLDAAIHYYLDIDADDEDDWED
jgi:cytosine/adenosine deaminase-related metal-dependent hydrolase